MILKKSPIFFGEVAFDKLPKLPKGFHFVIAPDAFLLAVSPDGKEYLVSETTLFRYAVATVEDAARTKGLLKVGQRYFYDRETIALS